MKTPDQRLFAVITDGVVSNIIVGVEDHVVAANPDLYVEYETPESAGIGWLYDGSTFTNPNAVEAPTTSVK